MRIMVIQTCWPLLCSQQMPQIACLSLQKLSRSQISSRPNSVMGDVSLALKPPTSLFFLLKNHFYYAIVVVDVRTHCTPVSSYFNVSLSSTVSYLIGLEHGVTLSESCSRKQENVVLLSESLKGESQFHSVHFHVRCAAYSV